VVAATGGCRNGKKASSATSPAAVRILENVAFLMAVSVEG
jgi:hypothetical protein